MRLHDMKYGDGTTKKTQVKFLGLNHTQGASDGEIWDMKNMTGDYTPLLAARKPRLLYKTLERPGGIYCWNKLCWVDGTGFYYDGELKGEVTDGSKKFAAMGPYVIIMPDKCFYNVESDTFGSLESEWSGESLTFSNGTLYGEDAEANTIQCEGVEWASWFRDGDAVTISGCTVHPENNKTPIIREIDGDKLVFYENVFKLDNDAAYTETGEMRIFRTMPDLDYLCENENRLWGCDGSTIYASKWGDPFNWNVFDGLESDAFAVTPTARGLFCGGISYKSFSIFSKEERIYKVYGSIPSSFKAVDSASLGVAEGSGESMAIAGETLFYLSRNGVMAYSGGIPQNVSQAFGMERFKNAVGGSDGMKYYVSMQGEDGAWWLYVYDTQTGLWHKEDQIHVTHFARCEGNLYMLNDLGEIWIDGNVQDPPQVIAEEGDVPWMVEFADFTEEDPNKKNVKRIQMRLELEENATATVWIQFDSDGIWHELSTMVCDGPKRSFCLPIVPRRCDHYRLKVEGTGGAFIHSLARTYSIGSEFKSRIGRN